MTSSISRPTGAHDAWSPWWRAAACSGLPPEVVFARREREAAPALRACARCPVARHCEETVAPADSWFDGVCAGRLWRNGRAVTRTPHTRHRRESR
ncbi:WhiB family transcriptional regulator [Streptomyces sp. NPDC051561]|uniref:WhiB family transcriptional regulator n=1 Tax=Streptomyces sp. NPDC051561 TaxID=3365658 RepID=UPI0037B5343F